MFTTLQLADDQPLVYPSIRTSPPRQYPLQGTSSAFSSAAGPDEDWTKISDLAERRRIQNRIAQRNYRRKLKRRLADLERRASSSDGATSPPTPTGPTPSRAYRVNKKRQAPVNGSKASSEPQLPSLSLSLHPSQPSHQHRQQRQQTQRSLLHSDPYPEQPQSNLLPGRSDDGFLFSSANSYDSRIERSVTPPMFNYSNYTNPDDALLAPFQSSNPPPFPHHHMSAPATETAYPSYLSAPVTLQPPTSSVSAPASASASGPSLKNEPYADDCFNLFGGYGFMPSMEIGGPTTLFNHPSSSSTANTPPLTYAHDHSTDCSDAGGWEYPHTPVSMPNSPDWAAQLSLQLPCN